jgi:CheY-like chemotaxis protein
LRIINDVLDFSKVEAGKSSIENIPFAPGPCIEQTIALVCGQLSTASGMDDYLAKPFSRAQLTAMLERHLSVSRSLNVA